MNYKQKFEAKRKLLNLIRTSNRSGSHQGCCRVFSNNSWEHERTKMYLMYNLLKRGLNCWSEVIFENGSRCDLLVFNPKTGASLIIEILHSETLEAAKKKVDKYPSEIDKVFVESKETALDEIYI